MHTAHCARNITLCPICKEPVAKAQLEKHKREFHVGNFGDTISSTHTPIKPSEHRNSSANSTVTNGYNTSTSSEITNRLAKLSFDKKVRNAAKTNPDLIPCKYCDLELLKMENTEHENYCGSRTDKCNACGDIVMFKNKKMHQETNHASLELNNEPTWDSAAQRAVPSLGVRGTNPGNSASPFSDDNYRPMALRTTSLLDTTLYSFPAEYRPPVRQCKANAESYKQITRRLDCKTEYIKNLLHDSANITVPIRTNPMTPRNHFNHSKGRAPSPPTQTSYTPTSSTTSPILSPTCPTLTPAELSPPTPTKLNPPTELCVPCDYCTLVLPHRDLIAHEMVCGRNYASTERAHANARRRREGGDGGAQQHQQQQQRVYSFDGDDGDRFYCAYKTSAPIAEGGGRLANGREGDIMVGGLSRLTATGQINSNSSTPTIAPLLPITVSPILSPTTPIVKGDYLPPRPSLVSSSTTPMVRFDLPPANAHVTDGERLSWAGVGAGAGNVSPEVQLPCEFCADMIPASQLLGHQATCF